MKAAHVFPNFIDYVRFPRFRSLEPGTRVDFTFPITVFVGQNGCGKSSALHAIFGAPAGKSTGNYWFETAIDPIEQTDEDRHCFIYSCNGAGAAGEVLKTRIWTPGKPERWDTSEAMKKYGMLNPGNRLAEPVEKDVVYINFRTAQNAFEKAFHEERPPASGVQDHIRSRSHSLKKVLEGRSPGRGYRGKTHQTATTLPPQELETVSEILGRTYASARLIKHRFFGMWGFSVILRSGNSTYSEAFAGSGESAVVLMVHEISAARPGSLLLLDEPETSLHPGAQSRVRDFLLRSCKDQKHQIVVCTHSPEMIRGLPPAAIKVFAPSPEFKFRVIPNILSAEAFFFLGQRPSAPCVVLVEDKLAKFMVEAVLETMDKHMAALFEIRFHPGGHSVMKGDAVYAERDHLNYWYLFDGDAFKPSPFNNDPLDSLSGSEVSEPSLGYKKLQQILKDWLGCALVFHADGADADAKKLSSATAYAKFASERFDCFPSHGADEAIWSPEIANSLMSTLLSADDAAALRGKLALESGAKERFARFSDAIVSASQANTIEVIHKMFVKAWVSRESEDRKAIEAFLMRARQSCS